MKRRAVLASTVAAAAGLAGCIGGESRALPTAPSGTWRQYAHDEGNAGASGASVPDRGSFAWASGDVQSAAPVVDDGTVFSVASEASAVDGRTGEVLWSVDLPGEAEGAPALTGDELVVATTDALVGLDREDGDTSWSTPLPRPAPRPLTLAADAERVIVPLAAREGAPGVYGYDATTGDERWSAPALAARTPAVADDAVYVTGYRADGDTGVLRALSLADGTERWARDLGSPDVPPVVSPDGILVGDAGTLAVHDPTDGTRTGTLGEFGDAIPVPPVVDDGQVFVTGSDGSLAAVSLADGELGWERDVGVVSDTGVAVGDDAVVAAVRNLPEGSLAGIAAYERDDGTPRWEFEIEGFDAFPTTPPVLADGAVFIASNEHQGVVALGDLPPRTD